MSRKSEIVYLPNKEKSDKLINKFTLKDLDRTIILNKDKNTLIVEKEGEWGIVDVRTNEVINRTEDYEANLKLLEIMHDELIRNNEEIKYFENHSEDSSWMEYPYIEMNRSILYEFDLSRINVVFESETLNISGNARLFKETELGWNGAETDELGYEMVTIVIPNIYYRSKFLGKTYLDKDLQKIIKKNMR